jgi:predicted RNA-binding Zn-ribbon protein involved in translation (DUF1610 family)
VDITFNCETCGRQLVIDEADAGTLVDCPKCRRSLLVPGHLKQSDEDATGSQSTASSLTQCPDCGREISKRATACPHCAAPLSPPPQSTQLRSQGGMTCPHCGSQSVGKVRGLQGVGEVFIGIILFFLCLIPGIIYYIYMESVPYCSGCGRRLP